MNYTKNANIREVINKILTKLVLMKTLILYLYKRWSDLEEVLLFCHLETSVSNT